MLSLSSISWGKSNNIIAVALHQSVYLWHASDSRIEELLTLEGDTDYISSVQWSMGEHPLLAVVSKTLFLLSCNLHISKPMFQPIKPYSNPFTLPCLLCSVSSFWQGTHDQVVQIYDADTMTQVRELEGHGARVSSLAWNNATGGGGSLLSSGVFIVKTTLRLP